MFAIGDGLASRVLLGGIPVRRHRWCFRPYEARRAASTGRDGALTKQVPEGGALRSLGRMVARVVVETIGIVGLEV